MTTLGDGDRLTNQARASSPDGGKGLGDARETPRPFTGPSATGGCTTNNAETLCAGLAGLFRLTGLTARDNDTVRDHLPKSESRRIFRAR